MAARLAYQKIPDPKRKAVQYANPPTVADLPTVLLALSMWRAMLHMVVAGIPKYLFMW